MNTDCIRAEGRLAPDTDARNIARMAYAYAVRPGEDTGGDLCLDGREVHTVQA